MATDVDTDGLRRLASRIDEAAPQDPPLSADMSGAVTGHARLASAIMSYDRTGVDAVRKLHADAQKMSSGLRDVARIYESADSSAEQSIRDVLTEL